MIFFVKGLHDFLVERFFLVKKMFSGENIFIKKKNGDKSFFVKRRKKMVKRLNDFFWWIGSLISKKRLCDFVYGEVAWFLCVERLRDFSH